MEVPVGQATDKLLKNHWYVKLPLAPDGRVEKAIAAGSALLQYFTSIPAVIVPGLKAGRIVTCLTPDAHNVLPFADTRQA